MKIAIVGNGKVGFALAKQLDQEGHDVTIIENKSKVLEDTMNRLDIIGVCGNRSQCGSIKRSASQRLRALDCGNQPR